VDINTASAMIDNLPGMLYRGLNNPPNYTYTYVSEGSDGLTGYSPDELVGQKLPDIVHPEDKEELYKLLSSTVSSGLPLEVTLRISTKKGEIKWVWFKSFVFDTDSEGMPYTIEGYYIDITNLMMKATAKFVNHAKSDFFNKMGAELRTVTNAIVGMAELSLREDMPASVRSYTGIIKETGGKLMSVLNNMLTLEMLKSGTIKIYNEDYSLSGLLKEITDTGNSMSQTGGVAFITDIDDKLPDALAGDADKLRQVLFNILFNAFKFTDEGSVFLTIGGDISDKLLKLNITVEDTGRGIREENIGNVFDEYTQFDDKMIEGLGLGLTIASGLMNMMNGEISVSSLYGLGSRFMLTISQEIRNFDKTLDLLREEDVYITAPKARVLIVDDISANLVVAEGLLEPYKIQVDLRESGEQAIEAVTKANYDLILMDYMMPVMDGVKTTYLIRELGKQVPIVALTANAMYTSGEIMREHGFDDFLPKPIETSRLKNIISKWIPDDKQVISSARGNTVKSEVFDITGLDVEKGMEMTGGTAKGYMMVLKSFYANGRRLLKEMKDCLEKDNISLYGIHVHALKSITSSIGSEELSRLAADLELASVNKDKLFIKSSHDKFHVALEMLLDNIAPAIDNGASSGSPLDTPKVKAKQKILIIDDSDSFLLILNSFLENDYETWISLDGEGGLEMAKSAKPDLILLDVMMPGLSGYDVIKELKGNEELKSVPVILITGKDSDENEAEGLALGAAGYIKKPFDHETVIDMVKKVLN